MFSPANLIRFLRKRGFNKHSNGVMRIFTDQFNAHVEKEAKRVNAPIIMVLEFTCQLQIDCYQEFSVYLERVKAPSRPLLMPYYLGVAYFETGQYKEAIQVFEQAEAKLKFAGSSQAIQPYKYSSQVMAAASQYQLDRQGEGECQ